MNIFIDAAHGGADTGGTDGRGRTVKDDALNLAHSLLNELRRLGHGVRMSRMEDADVTDGERAALAKRSGAGLCVIISRDKLFADANGVSAYYPPGAGLSAVRTAELACANLSFCASFKNLGARPAPYFPADYGDSAVLLRVGNIMNRVDNNRWDRNFGMLASAIADAVEVAASESPAFAKTQNSALEPDFNAEYAVVPGAPVYSLTGYAEKPAHVRLERFSPTSRFAECTGKGGEPLLIAWEHLRRAV